MMAVLMNKEVVTVFDHHSASGDGSEEIAVGISDNAQDNMHALVRERLHHRQHWQQPDGMSERSCVSVWVLPLCMYRSNCHSQTPSDWLSKKQK